MIKSLGGELKKLFIILSLIGMMATQGIGSVEIKMSTKYHRKIEPETNNIITINNSRIPHNYNNRDDFSAHFVDYSRNGYGMYGAGINPLSAILLIFSIDFIKGTSPSLNTGLLIIFCN